MRTHFLYLIIAIFFVYLPSLVFGFVWDDYLVLVDNAFVQNFDNLPLIFSREYLTTPASLPFLNKAVIGAGELTYRPVNTLIHFVEFQLWGLNPLGYRVLSLMLHIATVSMFYLVLYRLGLSLGIAFWVALFFGLHPVHVETVVNISFREDLLAAFFGLAVFYLYAQHHHKSKNMWLMYACLALALFSKESAVAVLGIIWVYDVLIRRQVWKQWPYYLGFVGVSVLYFWIWAGPMARDTAGKITYPLDSLWVNVWTMLKVWGGYVQWLIIPVGIHPTAVDPLFFETQLWNLGTVLGGVVLALMVFYLFHQKRLKPIEKFGLVWYGIALLPVLNIIPINNVMAARYLYLPSMGLFLVAASLLSRYQVNKTCFKGWCFSGIIVFYIVMIALQFRVWPNELTFRSAMLKRYPHLFQSYQSLAATYYDQGNKTYAYAVLLEAQKRFPNQAQAYFHPALMMMEIQRYDRAAEHLEKGLERIEKDKLSMHHLLCQMYSMTDWSKADVCFETLNAIYPNHALIQANRDIYQEWREQLEQGDESNR